MKTIINICVLLSFAFGGFFYLTKTLAKAEDLQKLEKRLDYKIISDQVDRKKSEIREIKKKYPDKGKMPESIREDYEELQEEKASLQRQLEVLEKEKK